MTEGPGGQKRKEDERGTIRIERERPSQLQIFADLFLKVHKVGMHTVSNAMFVYEFCKSSFKPFENRVILVNRVV